MRKIITNLTIALSLIAAVVTPASAIETPNFPSCLSPQGTLRVFYPDGTHGIVGSTDNYQGSDTVYNLNSDMQLQCFCSVNGTGIQTNWWLASSLSDEQVEILKKDGWFYVPNGSLWGLEASPYVAKNISYSCLATPRPSSSQSNNDSNNQSNNNSNNSTQEGEVLGLAATGDSLTLLILSIIAFLLIGIGVSKSRHEKN